MHLEDLLESSQIDEDVRFFSRHQMCMPWHLILCIDQSGSMASSVIHSAVLAGILAKLPMLSLKFIVFGSLNLSVVLKV